MRENQNEKGVPYDPNCYRCREKARKPRAGTDRLCAHHKDEAVLMLANENATLRARVAEMEGLSLSADIFASAARLDDNAARVTELEKEHKELVVLLDVDHRDDDSPVTVVEAAQELLTEKQLARQHVDELAAQLQAIEDWAQYKHTTQVDPPDPRWSTALGEVRVRDAALAHTLEEEQVRVAELEAKLAEAERESVMLRAEISGAHGAMKLCNVPEQIPPFKVPLAPLAARVMYLDHERDNALAEAARLREEWDTAHKANDDLCKRHVENMGELHRLREENRRRGELLVEYHDALAELILLCWPAVREEGR